MTNPPSSRELARRRMAQARAEKEATQKQVESLESEIANKEQELDAVKKQYEEDVKEIGIEIASLHNRIFDLTGELIPPPAEQIAPTRRRRKAVAPTEAEPQHEEVIPLRHDDEAPKAKPSLKARAKRVSKFIVGDPKSGGSQRG